MEMKYSKEMKTKLPKIILSIIGIITISYLITVSLAPANKNKQYVESVYSDTVLIKNFDTAYCHSEIIEMAREMWYKESLLELSKHDSIHMVIDLIDSTVSLSISGVFIHKTKIEKFEKDKLLNNFSLIQEFKFLLHPLLITSQYATIVKEPIVERDAPKDTLEASLNAWKPDTLVQNPAFASFMLENDIRIIFEQDTITNSVDEYAKQQFSKYIYGTQFKKTISNFVKFKKQEYIPTIVIYMPVDDLRAVYRALPYRSYVVLRYK